MLTLLRHAVTLIFGPFFHVFELHLNKLNSVTASLFRLLAGARVAFFFLRY